MIIAGNVRVRYVLDRVDRVVTSRSCTIKETHYSLIRKQEFLANLFCDCGSYYWT